MSYGDILLGLPGFESLLEPMDRTYTKKRIFLGREERTADGTLVVDVIARKFQFVLSWETLDNEKLGDLIGPYNTDADLNLIVYTDNTLYDEYTVRMQPFDQTRLLVVGSKYGYSVWSGVTVTLDEV